MTCDKNVLRVHLLLAQVIHTCSNDNRPVASLSGIFIFCQQKLGGKDLSPPAAKTISVKIFRLYSNTVQNCIRSYLGDPTCKH